MTLLDASSIDYKFSFGVYATEIQTSPFSDATSTSAIIQSYPTEEIGDDTYTETALQEIESKFNGGDDGVRGGDTPKVGFLFCFFTLQTPPGYKLSWF